MRTHAQLMHRQAAWVARPHVGARSAGGAAIPAILRGPAIQPKLTINALDNSAEADRVADEVMRRATPQTAGGPPPVRQA